VGQVLVEAGAIVRATRHGYTPLHISAAHGHVGASQMLIGAGGDVYAKTDEDGSTPLHLSAEHGHMEVSQALLRAGTNVNVTSKVVGRCPNQERSTEIHGWGTSTD